MTEEQIEQNARVYANKEYMLCTSGEKEAAIKDFIAGAHSRDEEIYDLKRDIEDLQEMVKMRSTAFACARNEIERLSNPWISVEDRLPDIGQKVITITNKGKMLLVARTTQPPHKEEGGWRWEHYIGKVTHWMSIPELKGE